MADTVTFSASRAKELVAMLRDADAALPAPVVAQIDVFDANEGYVAIIADADTSLLAYIGTDVDVHRADPWTERDSYERDCRYRHAKESEAMRQASAIAALRNCAPELCSQLEAALVELEKLEAVYDAAICSLDVIYKGHTHPRCPAYPHDELLHAVNAIRLAK